MRFTFGSLYRLERAFGSLDKLFAGPQLETAVRLMWAARLADEPDLKIEDVERECESLSIPEFQALSEKVVAALAESGLTGA